MEEHAGMRVFPVAGNVVVVVEIAEKGERARACGVPNERRIQTVSKSNKGTLAVT